MADPNFDSRKQLPSGEAKAPSEQVKIRTFNISFPENAQTDSPTTESPKPSSLGMGRIRSGRFRELFNSYRQQSEHQLSREAHDIAGMVRSSREARISQLSDQVLELRSKLGKWTTTLLRQTENVTNQIADCVAQREEIWSMSPEDKERAEVTAVRDKLGGQNFRYHPENHLGTPLLRSALEAGILRQVLPFNELKKELVDQPGTSISPDSDGSLAFHHKGDTYVIKPLYEGVVAVSIIFNNYLGGDTTMGGIIATLPATTEHLKHFVNQIKSGTATGLTYLPPVGAEMVIPENGFTTASRTPVF